MIIFIDVIIIILINIHNHALTSIISIISYHPSLIIISYHPSLIIISYHPSLIIISNHPSLLIISIVTTYQTSLIIISNHPSLLIISIVTTYQTSLIIISLIHHLSSSLSSITYHHLYHPSIIIISNHPSLIIISNHPSLIIISNHPSLLIISIVTTYQTSLIIISLIHQISFIFRCFHIGMKFYAVGIVRAILPNLRNRLSKVRVAAITAIHFCMIVPDRAKRKAAGMIMIMMMM
jgi:hypothetical protein